MQKSVTSKFYVNIFANSSNGKDGGSQVIALRAALSKPCKSPSQAFYETLELFYTPG